MTPKRKARSLAKSRKSADPDILPLKPDAEAASPVEETAAEETEAPDAEARLDAVPDAAVPDAAALQVRLTALQIEFEGAAAKWREREDQLLRLVAETENRVKRLGKEAEWDRQRYRSDSIKPMLAVLDDLERALELRTEEAADAFGEGVSLIADRFREALAGLGLRPIVAIGEKFDPNLHEALMQVADTEAEKGFVIQEIQKGYTLGDRVLRPSKVAVSG